MSVVLTSRIARPLLSIHIAEKLGKLYSDIKKNEEEVLKYETMSVKASAVVFVGDTLRRSLMYIIASYSQYMDVRKILCTYEDYLQG